MQGGFKQTLQLTNFLGNSANPESFRGEQVWTALLSSDKGWSLEVIVLVAIVIFPPQSYMIQPLGNGRSLVPESSRSPHSSALGSVATNFSHSPRST